jgi:membrane protein insertase Oxa1/YidC/SpoIIIJ
MKRTVTKVEGTKTHKAIVYGAAGLVVAVGVAGVVTLLSLFWQAVWNFAVRMFFPAAIEIDIWGGLGLGVLFALVANLVRAAKSGS